MKKIFLLIITLTVSLAFIQGCQDQPPNDYIPQNFVEAYLFVDQPIQGILVMRTLPVQDSFKYTDSFIPNADVNISEGANSYNLVYKLENGVGSYFFPDSSILIKPNTQYNLTVKMPDGSMVTGQTTTPGRISWSQPPADTLHYPPNDSLGIVVPDSLHIKWHRVPDVSFYLIRITCLDSLNYGKYLLPQTTEPNARIDRGGDMGTNPEVTKWGIWPDTITPIVWNTFKWFGLHEGSVMAPDYNLLRWFVQDQRSSTVDTLLSSVHGAIGVCGSASIVSKKFFLLKK